MTLRIATRSSNLALWQANYVRSELARVGIAAELIEVSTLGDRDRSTALASLGGLGEAGQGVFTKEVQRVVLDDAADLAVHSLKDLPTAPTAGLTLAAVPPRAETNDVLALPDKAAIASLDELPPGSRIGTGSPRRVAMLRRARPDITCLPIRGNVETRLAKCDAGEYDAVVLAEAGLIRLGLADRISLRLEPPIMWPAVSQAALGIECRDGDERTQQALATLNHADTAAAVTAERSLLATLRAGCGAAVGVRTVVDGDNVELAAIVLNLDGTQAIEAAATQSCSTAAALGTSVAETLLERDAGELIAD